MINEAQNNLVTIAIQQLKGLPKAHGISFQTPLIDELSQKILKETPHLLDTEIRFVKNAEEIVARFKEGKLVSYKNRKPEEPNLLFLSFTELPQDQLACRPLSEYHWISNLDTYKADQKAERNKAVLASIVLTAMTTTYLLKGTDPLITGAFEIYNGTSSLIGRSVTAAGTALISNIGLMAGTAAVTAITTLTALACALPRFHM